MPPPLNTYKNMKERFENEDVTGAYVTIDMCDVCIAQVNERLMEPKDNVILAIDGVTGYQTEADKKDINLIIDLLNSKIAAKKFIEADYSKDTEFLAKMKQRLKSL